MLDLLIDLDSRRHSRGPLHQMSRVNLLLSLSCLVSLKSLNIADFNIVRTVQIEQIMTELLWVLPLRLLSMLNSCTVYNIGSIRTSYE